MEVIETVSADVTVDVNFYKIFRLNFGLGTTVKISIFGTVAKILRLPTPRR